MRSFKSTGADYEEVKSFLEKWLLSENELSFCGQESNLDDIVPLTRSIYASALREATSMILEDYEAVVCTSSQHILA